jgi:uncharacterized protein YjiS (DUF1127 family)
MTTLALQAFADERPNTNGFLSGLLRVFVPVKRWYGRRQTLVHLSHLDEHLLRDLGFEPSDVDDALNGEDSPLWDKWEELHGLPKTR